LKEGESYTVESVEIGGWTSYVKLNEVPERSFNTVMFMEAERYWKEGLPPTEYIRIPAFTFTEEPEAPRTHQTTVYLAGSVHGHVAPLAYEIWRQEAARILEAAGYRTLNPVRGRRFKQDYEPDELTSRDLSDIMNSDVILVEMAHEGMPYIGTSMEIYQASLLGKPIIVWGKANTRSFWMRRFAPERYSEFHEALKALMKRYGPETEPRMRDEDLPF